MSVEREMTLAEWCAKLPSQHLVNRELATLTKQLAALTKLIEEIKAQGPIAWRFDLSEDSYTEKWGFTESEGLAKSGDPRAVPLYRLPEGD